MQYVVTNAQMKAAEEICNRDSISYIRMMQNAGTACAEEILRIVPRGSYITILCGSGNNGGDGFVISSVLAEHGISSAVILVNGEPKTDCAKHHFDMLFGAQVMRWDAHHERCIAQLMRTDAVIDCIYGTGFRGELADTIRELLEASSHCRYRIAVDVPSGINSDNGEFDKGCFKPTHTLVLAAMKAGLLSLPANDMLGDTKLLDIGIDEKAYSSDYIAKMTDKSCAHPFPERRKSSHKGSFGRLLNIAGCLCYNGAAAMSTKAALRTGVGLCTLAAPVSVVKMLAASIHETTYLPLPETDEGFVNENAFSCLSDHLGKATAVSIGCGMGNSDNTRKIVEFVIKNTDRPIIIDADGINSIAANIDILKERKGKLIITPHPLEFSRISGLSLDDIDRNRITAAKQFAEKYGVTVVLKGSNTVIASENGEIYVNASGNSGLAKGGSGDVLTGIIAAMAAQGIDTFKAAVCGVYCHGAAADLLLERMPAESILPTDVIEALPEIYRSR